MYGPQVEPELSPREIARAEVARALRARAAQVREILIAGPDAAEKHIVRRYCDSLPGVLGEHWRRFVNLPLQDQLAALDSSELNGMAWHSLLQCNPYAMLERWKLIVNRMYA